MPRTRPRRGGRARPRERPPAPEPLRVPVVDAHCHLDIADGRRRLRSTTRSPRAAAVGVPRMVQIGCDVPRRAVGGRDGRGGTTTWSPASRCTRTRRRAGGGRHLDDALAEIDAARGRPVVAPSARPASTSSAPDRTAAASSRRRFRAHIEIAKRHRQGAGDPRPRRARRRARGCWTRRARRSGSSSTASPATPRWRGHCVEPRLRAVLRRHRDVQERRALREALRVAPLDRLLVETDAPFLTPMPHRGRPNAPYLVPLTVRAMAAVTGVDEDDAGHRRRRQHRGGIWHLVTGLATVVGL